MKDWEKFDPEKLEKDHIYLFHNVYQFSDDLERYEVLIVEGVNDKLYDLDGFGTTYHLSKIEKNPFDYFIELEDINWNYFDKPDEGELVIGLIRPAEGYESKDNIQVFQIIDKMFSNNEISYFSNQMNGWIKCPKIDFNYIMKKCLMDILQNEINIT